MYLSMLDHLKLYDTRAVQHKYFKLFQIHSPAKSTIFLNASLLQMQDFILTKNCYKLEKNAL